MLPILVSIISKVSPILGTALGGPAGGIVGSLISAALGVDLNNPQDVVKKLEDPESVSKLKELEMQIGDLQSARSEASKETGPYRLVRPLMALFAMLAVFADIVAIEFVSNEMVSQILIIMMVFLVWDIRQIYKFYFGSGEEVSSFLLPRGKR